MREPTALVVGEALTDVVIGADGIERARPGGSPANVAVGLARLGVPTDLLCRIGPDAYGDALRAHLEQAGVGLVEGTTAHPDRTSTATAHISADGGASYRFDIEWDPGVIAAGPVKVLHTGSLATVLEPGAAAVLNALTAAGPETIVSLDPNVRPSVGIPQGEVLARTEAAVRCAHLVKMSDEDLEWLYPGATCHEVAEKMHGLGVRLVIVTLGARGCFLSTPQWSSLLPAVATTVVDTIGAGDAFMSGFLYAVIAADGEEAVRTGELPQGLVEGWTRTALRSAAITVGRHGAQPPELADL